MEEVTWGNSKLTLFTEYYWSDAVKKNKMGKYKKFIQHLSLKT
jgi:hypothetical protein